MRKYKEDNISTGIFEFCINGKFYSKDKRR